MIYYYLFKIGEWICIEFDGGWYEEVLVEVYKIEMYMFVILYEVNRVFNN